MKAFSLMVNPYCSINVSFFPRTISAMALTSHPPRNPAVSQFVIPAKSRGAGCEPGSRVILFPVILLDSGSRPRAFCSPGMTVLLNYDTGLISKRCTRDPNIRHLPLMSKERDLHIPQNSSLSFYKNSLLCYGKEWE
jgi:hypothetical protein